MNDLPDIATVKPGDYVGIAGTWTDEDGLQELGIVVEVEEIPVLETKLATDWFGDTQGWVHVLTEAGDIEQWEINALEIIFAAKE